MKMQPNKPKSARKATKFEFSKKLVLWTNIAFWAQVFATILQLAVGAGMGEPLTAILATTATLAGAVHIGYFGKAGVENYRKIGLYCDDNDLEADEE